MYSKLVPSGKDTDGVWSSETTEPIPLVEIPPTTRDRGSSVVDTSLAVAPSIVLPRVSTPATTASATTTPVATLSVSGVAASGSTPKTGQRTIQIRNDSSPRASALHPDKKDHHQSDVPAAGTHTHAHERS